MGVLSCWWMRSDHEKETILHDSLFRRIVVLATMLSFAATAATGASFRLNGQMFVWHWSIPFWMAVGVFAAWYLSAQVSPTPVNKRRFLIFCSVVGLSGVGVFLWPVLAASAEIFWDLIRGLATAGVFLVISGSLIFWFVKSLLSGESEEGAQPQDGSVENSTIRR
jgi:hypothetical protein